MPKRRTLSRAAAAITSAAALAAPAHAMTVHPASAMRPALEASGSPKGDLEQVVYVCRHRYYTSRRVCWWRPTGSWWRPWRRWHR